MRILEQIGTVAAVAMLCTGCSAQTLLDHAPTLTQSPAQTVEVTADPASPTAALTLSAITPDAPLTLHIWIPEPLAPIDNQVAADLLSQQIGGFLRANPDVQVEIRLKRPTDVGGVLSALRTASAVAPDVLPDITLLRRGDLIAAVEGGYIEPLDSRLPTDFFENFDSRVTGLGRIDEHQYGVPYSIDMLHTAYNPTVISISSWTFDDVLHANVPFLFPGNRPGAVNDTLLAQLIGMGGTLDADGALTLDQPSLTAIFAFYQHGAEAGVITPDVLSYTDPSAYTEALVSGHAVGVINARLFRQLIRQGAPLAAGLIPTGNGSPITVIDGWMWVVVTSDARRQDAALRFITWMLDAERQQRYTDATGYIPSLRNALRLWDNPDYAAFIDQLLVNAVYPSDTNSAAVGRLLQNALTAVINRNQSANAAVQTLMGQLGG